MKSTNPYRPASATEHRVQEEMELPIPFWVLAVLDVIACGVIAIVAIGTWWSPSEFATGFVATEVMVGSLLAGSLLATSISLFLKRPHAWRLLIVSQCTLAFLVLVSYTGLAYVLIDTWGHQSMMYSGGDPKSLATATLIYIVAQTASAIPIVVLVRNRPDRRIVGDVHNPEI